MSDESVDKTHLLTPVCPKETAQGPPVDKVLRA